MGMVHDAAEYFCKHVERVLTEHPHEALRYYGWWKNLFLNYERLEERSERLMRKRQ